MLQLNYELFLQIKLWAIFTDVTVKLWAISKMLQLKYELFLQM